MRVTKKSGGGPIAAVLLLPAIGAVLGLVLVGLGIREAAHDTTRGYLEVTGYLTDYALQEAGGYDPQRSTETADTYRLVYRYNVDGRAYTLVTDYSTSFLPSRGSEATILYDPANPAASALDGPNRSENHLAFIGMFFLLGSLVFFLPFLPEKKQRKRGGKPSKCTAADRVGVCIGLLFLGVSYGALAVICNSYSPLGIARYYIHSFHFMLLVPLLMLAAGAAMLVKSLPHRKKQKPKPTDFPAHRDETP